jgi:hypothetical protein
MPARGHGAKWPRLLKKAARTLARTLTRGRSYAHAARRVGISRSTMFNWSELPEFRAIYHAERQRLLKGPIYEKLQIRPALDHKPAA